MGRVGLTMAGLALVTVALSTLIPVIGSLVIAPLTALIIGAGAGWWASKVLGYGTAGRGAGAGAIAGLGALLGSVIGLALLLSIAANNPEVQRGIQEGLENAQQQNPDVVLPENFDPGAILGVGGAFVGFCFGLFDLFLATIGGLVAGLVYGRNRQPLPATPVGGYPVQGTGVPQMTNTYTTESDRGARVYPDTESDRGARVYPDDERRE